MTSNANTKAINKAIAALEVALGHHICSSECPDCNMYDPDVFEEAITELKALKESVGEPLITETHVKEGYVLLPKEPTEDMLAIELSTSTETYDDYNGHGETWVHISDDEKRDFYKAMINASLKEEKNG